MAPGARLPFFEDRPWGRFWRLGGNGSQRRRRGRRIFAQLSSALADFRPDMIHLHVMRCFRDNQLTALWRACSARRVPVGLTFHSWDRVTGERPQRGRRWRLLDEAFRRAAWVTVISPSVAEDIRRTDGASRRVAVVPSGFDPGEFRGRPAPLPLPAGSRFILCAARLHYYKGIDLLLLAWRDVCARFPGVTLVLCGPDHFDGYFQSLAAKLGLGRRVRFLGLVERPALRALMRRCLFLVLPSRFEIFGMAAVEAMACAKPVLATRVGGLAHVVQDGRTGLLVAPKDPAALAAGLERLLRDAPLRRRLGAAALARSPRYRWEAAALAYLRLSIFR